MRSLSNLYAFFLVVALTACNASPIASPTAALSTETATPHPATITPVPSPTLAPTQVIPEYLQVKPSSLRGVKVTLWTPWVGAADDEMQTLIGIFNLRNEWGIKAEARSFGSPMVVGEELALALEQGTTPQVVLSPDEQLARWEEASDLVVDLEPYLNHYLWGLGEKQQDDFNPAFWQQGRFEEKRTSIPATRTVYGLIYNRTWAAELGFVNPPVTPEQFYEQACAAAEANNTGRERIKYGTGGWLVNTQPEVALSWLAAFGADPFPIKDQTEYQFDQPLVKEAFEFYLQMQKGGCLWEGKTPSAYDYFADRFALFYSGTLQDLPLQEHVQERKTSKDEWSFLAYPSKDGKGVLYAHGDSYAILNGSPEQQMASWLLVRWLANPQQQTRLVEAALSLPVGDSSAGELSTLKTTFPWNTILPLVGQARPVPGPASWALVRSLLQDAAWQVLRLPSPDQLPLVISDLEAMSQELTQPGARK